MRPRAFAKKQRGAKVLGNIVIASEALKIQQPAIGLRLRQMFRLPACASCDNNRVNEYSENAYYIHAREK
jgi:hypothetical protein